MEWRDKAQAIALKETATARLSAVAWERYGIVRAADARLWDYVRAVATAPDGHNVWEQLAVLHFLRKIDEYGLNTAKIRAFFRFYEQLRFPTQNGAERYRLTPVQCFQFASIFGFWRDGRRIVRTAVLFVPRKFSKTTSSAAFAVWDLLFGDANAECYTGANSADQAKKCFGVIRETVMNLDPGGHRFLVNQGEIRSMIPGRTARAQCLTANARTKDGLNASTIIMDEFSQAADDKLLRVLTTSTGARRNPLTVIITTASDKFDGPFHAMLQGCKNVLAGQDADDSLFAHLFEPDVGDDESDPATWRKVQPHMGVTVDETSYAEALKTAQREGAGAMLAFRTKMLNQYATMAGQSWITRDLLAEVVKPYNPSQLLRGRWACSVAVDLSVCDDLTAVCAAYHCITTGRIHFAVDYFFPEDALPGHIDEDKYRQWAAEGALHLTRGKVVDYKAVADFIKEISRRVGLIGIAYDAAYSADMVNNLTAYGLGKILWPVGQGYNNFSDPVFALEKWIKSHGCDIDPNPITLWCFDNCLMDENNYGRKPIKRTHGGKIDGVIAMLMATRQLLHRRV